MSQPIDALNAIAARWEHGHAELTTGCSLCQAEYQEVWQVVHGNPTQPPASPQTGS